MRQPQRRAPYIIGAAGGAAVALASMGVAASSPPPTPPSVSVVEAEAEASAVASEDVAAARAALPAFVTTTPPADDTPCGVITIDAINAALAGSDPPLLFAEWFADPSPLDAPSASCGGAFVPLDAADTTTGATIVVADFGDSSTYGQFLDTFASDGVALSSVDTTDPSVTVQGSCENLDAVTQCFVFWEASGFVIAVQIQVVGTLDVEGAGTVLTGRVVPAVVGSMAGTDSATPGSVAPIAPETTSAGDAPFDADAIVPDTAPAPEYETVPG